MDYIENPVYYDENNDENYDNIYNMISEFKSLGKELSSFRKDYNKFVSSSPFHFSLEDIDNKFLSSDNSINASIKDENFSLKESSDDKLAEIVKKGTDTTNDLLKKNNLGNDKINEGLKNIDKGIDDLGDKFESSNGGKAFGGLKSLLSGVLKAVAGVIGGAAVSFLNTYPQRVINEYDDMVASRNELMNQYGLENNEEGIRRADELYKMRFEHKPLPYQRRTAPEQREYERSMRKTAIDLGYNTEESVKVVSDHLAKWSVVFEDINLASSKLFQNTIRFVDKTGKVTDTLLSKIKEVSTNYIVSPSLLEEVSSSYSKYLRIITKSNTAYTKSMSGLIETVGKLEDAGVKSQNFISSVEEFQYKDISNASDSEMWTRLSILGINPMDFLMMDPGEATKVYTDALKNYFKDYDLTNGQDRLRVNTIAQQHLGFSSGEMKELYTLIKSGQESENKSDENIKKIDDHTAKIAIDMESYYDKAMQQWTYMTEYQKHQDELSLDILNNKYYEKFYNKYHEMTDKLNVMTGGFADLKSVIGTITTTITGGALLEVIKKAITSTAGGAAGSAAGTAAGTAAGAGGGAAIGTGALNTAGGAAGIGVLGTGLAGLAIGGGLGYLIGEDKRKDLESGKSIIIHDDASGEDLVFSYKDGLRHQTEEEELAGVPFEYYYDRLKSKASSAYETISDYGGKASEYVKENNIYTRYDNNKSEVLKEYLDNSTDYINRAELPSHASGLDRVPFDNYIAKLHKNERVLTSNESNMMDIIMKQNTGIFGGFQDDSVEALDTNSDLLGNLINIFSKEGSSDNMINGIDELDDSMQQQIKNSEGLLKSFDPSNKSGMLSNMINFDNTNKEGNKLTADNTTKISDNTLSVDGLKGKIKDLSEGITSLIDELKNLAKSKFDKYSGKLKGNTLASIADKVINGQEGTYNSINHNDNGALSIGKVQWHAGRAQNLLKDIYEASPQEFKSIADKYGAGNLINSIKNDDWSNKVLSVGSSEYNAIKEILSTDVGKKIQDELSQKDITDYISVGKSYGLKDPAALIYFADFANQYGQGSELLKRVTKEALDNGGTLDSMYEATRNNTSEYLTRRKSVYDEIKSMNLNDELLRSRIVEAAESAIGKPYIWGGYMYDNGGKGADCSGLVYYAYKEAGAPIASEGRQLADWYYEKSHKISFDELLPGDLVFKHNNPNDPEALNDVGHVGIFAGDNRVIEAKGSQYGIKNSSLSEGWQSAGRLLAKGGEITYPTVALIGEGGYKEYVISTDPKFSDRSTELIGKAASDIGVASLSNTAAESAPQVTEVYVDTDGIIDAVEELSRIVKRGFESLNKKTSDSVPPDITTNNNSIMNYV